MEAFYTRISLGLVCQTVPVREKVYLKTTQNKYIKYSYIGTRSENTISALWVKLSFSRFQNAQMNPLSTLEHQTKTLKNNHRHHLEYFPNLVLL